MKLKLLGLPFLTLTIIGIASGCSPKPKAATSTTVSRRGQVFIVTEGRENVRLGLVSVNLYPESVIVFHIAHRRASVAAVRDSLTRKVHALTAAYRTARGNVVTRDMLWQRWARTTGEDTEELDRATQDWQNADEIAAKTEARAAAAEAELREAEARADYLGSSEFFMADLPKPVATAESDANGDFVIGVPSGGQYVIAAQAERKVWTKIEHYAWLFRVPADHPKGSPILLSNNTLTTAGSPLSLVLTSR